MHTSLLWILILFVFFIVTVKADAEDIFGDETLIVRTSDDVELEYYGESPCKPFTPKMPDFRAPGRRISEVKCFEYMWTNKFEMQEASRTAHCDFVLKRTRYVIGGVGAEYGQYPHMGALGWQATDGAYIFKCGASLISNNFALTAAHCSSITRGDSTVVDLVPKVLRLSALTITNDKDYGDEKIKRIIVHDQYRSPRLYYDIALVEIEKPIRISFYKHPACLYNSFRNPEKASITGWGVTNLATFKTSPVLQQAEVKIMTPENCSKLLNIKRNRNWDGLDYHQICAGHLPGGIDTCQGDSGGPLTEEIVIRPISPTVITWHAHRVIGITSFGYGCGRANSPGVYTRVASFLDWIEGIVWPEEKNFEGETSEEK